MTSTAQSIRDFTGPVFFERGFRPFFFFASLFAGLAIPAWGLMHGAGYELPSVLGNRLWHVHEMVFGFLPAVITGFVLTAIPNWTGRLPFNGWPLAGLLLIWLLGRIAMAISLYEPVTAAVIDATYLVVLSYVIAREVIAGKNWRNFPIVAAIGLIAVANCGFHLLTLTQLDTELFVRLALACVAMLMILVGGRVVPSFTRNWLAKRSAQKLPVPMGLLDKVVVALSLITLTTWVFLPDSNMSSALFAAGAVGMLLRLVRWRGWATFSEPLVVILHVGYWWIAFWMALMAAAGYFENAIGTQDALHALTAGAVGSMTLAIMTRASLGHSGGVLTAGWLTQLIYLLVISGALLRVFHSFVVFDLSTTTAIAGLLWGGAYLLFAIGYGPIFFTRR